MNQYRYTLEPYKGMKTRYTCPNCGKKKVFSRYIDIETQQHLEHHVGRCSREVKCGYHYTPKQFFQDSPLDKPKPIQLVPPAPPLPVSYIGPSVFRASLKHYEANHLVRFLLNHFGDVITHELIRKYLIGTSKHWSGATVFWQIDQQAHIRTGKIMLYNPTTGKRVKEPYKHINWVHKVMKIPDFNLQQCFFGEHLLKTTNKPIAIVESEKTAIIASVYLPEFTWLAAGSLSSLTAEKCRVLKGRKVILWPDLNAFDKWQTRAELLGMKDAMVVSDFLEKQASEADRQKGFDLADYLLR